jgi:hypothetical protein
VNHAVAFVLDVLDLVTRLLGGRSVGRELRERLCAFVRERGLLLDEVVEVIFPRQQPADDILKPRQPATPSLSICIVAGESNQIGFACATDV